MVEKYIPGYSSNATSFMAKRNVDSHAAFFKPYLQPGMKLLDCGCGSGTITLGFAKIIAPSTAIGTDIESSQVGLAWENAQSQGISNVEFREGSVYELPFSDRAFDAAFSHAVFEHLQSPLKALQELFRVLKPGGVLGLRSPDWGGFLIAPSNPELDRAITYYKLLQEKNGGNPYVGRHLRALLREAGFTDIKASGSYECYEDLSTIAEYLALRIESSDTVDLAVQKGWTDAESLGVMSQALRKWSQHPDGLFAQAWCEVVGRKG
ncbi:MAG: methyltransferase domain-containing protein [Kastovskya adunca ATA6-11-RM4]|jgi:ubiquinone/menaquinone biosynthesis C-methylase UbiE|nr:methyltransferase domain-containing protein [Kastovskya adunca ATA6-11-RM4]